MGPNYRYTLTQIFLRTAQNLNEIETITICLTLSRPGIPGPDSLSTLSTATELLQLLMPSNTPEVPSKSEDTTDDPESSAMETEGKEEDKKLEAENKENDGDKVEEMNVDVEESNKDQQIEKGWKFTLYLWKQQQTKAEKMD